MCAVVVAAIGSLFAGKMNMESLVGSGTPKNYLLVQCQTFREVRDSTHAKKQQPIADVLYLCNTMNVV